MNHFETVGVREELEREIGAYLLATSFLSTTLDIMVPALGRSVSGDSGRAVASIESKDLASKIRALGSVLPETWKHKRGIIQALDDARELRNRFAHDVLAMGGVYDGVSVGWHLSQSLVRGEYREVDVLEIMRARLTVKLLTESVSVITNEPYTRLVSTDVGLVDLADREQWNEFDLVSLLIERPSSWRSEREPHEYAAIADSMFGPTIDDGSAAGRA